MEQFLLLIYETGLTALLFLVGPFLLLNRKARAGLWQKLGFIDSDLAIRLGKLNRPTWFHAVSVGEFNAAWPFIQAYQKRFPNKDIVISTTTATGQALAKERAGQIATVFFFPFDLPWIVNKWLNLVNPELVCIMETELWPAFMDACKKRNLPAVILNGRLSPRSFKRHKLISALSAPMLRKFALIGAQTQAEAIRYRAIGGDDLPVSVFGNLKYDGLTALDRLQVANLASELRISEGELVLVAGSTHDGEETMALNVLKQFMGAPENKSSALRLIIAPRHPERFERVAELIEQSGYSVRRHSMHQSFEERSDVFLLDTIGSLSKFYSLASVAFVGGTLAPVGGHNLVEPYAYAVPVVSGPSLYKTKDIANTLLENDALRVGHNRVEVEQLLVSMLTNRGLRERIGSCGKDWLQDNQGAVERALKSFESLVEARKQTNSVTRQAEKASSGRHNSI